MEKGKVAAMKKVTALSLIWSGIKLNFLQVAWNFERLQNVGFLFSIYNILKRIYADSRENLLKAVERHLNFFNTHIFFSTAALGVITRLEEQLDNSDQEQKEKEIEATKLGIMGPLAAIGDSLFWSGIKPFALLLAAGIVYLSGYSVKTGFIAALTALLVYNIPRGVIKYYLLFESYYRFQELFLKIQKVKFQDIMKSIKIVGMGLLGGIMAGFFVLKDLDLITSRPVDSVLLMGIFSMIVAAMRRKTAVSHIFVGVIFVSIIISYLIV